MEIKFTLFTLVALIFILPLTALADYNSVQYGNGTYLLYGSPSCLLINGGNGLSSLSVTTNTSNSVITLTGEYIDSEHYSSINLISPSRMVLNNSWGLETTCQENQSKLSIVWGPETPETISITTSENFCSGGMGDTTICLGETIKIIAPSNWEAPNYYEYIADPNKIKLYRGTTPEPGTNNIYGYPKINPLVRETLLNSSLPYEYISNTNRFPLYKNIIGVIEKYGIPKDFWIIPEGYEYITGPSKLKLYKNIITEPGTYKKYGIPKGVWTAPSIYEHIKMPYMISQYKNIIKEPNSLRLWGIKK